MCTDRCTYVIKLYFFLFINVKINPQLNTLSLSTNADRNFLRFDDLFPIPNEIDKFGDANIFSLYYLQFRHFFWQMIGTHFLFYYVVFGAWSSTDFVLD